MAKQAVTYAFGVMLVMMFLQPFRLYAQNTSLPVGIIPYEAGVGAIGNATYTIPIEVVPGTKEFSRTWAWNTTVRQGQDYWVNPAS